MRAVRARTHCRGVLPSPLSVHPPVNVGSIRLKGLSALLLQTRQFQVWKLTAACPAASVPKGTPHRPPDATEQALRGVAEALFMAPDRRIRDFCRVAAADEHPPGLVPLAIAVERQREAAVEQLDRDRELVLLAVARKRGVDQVALDPTPFEVSCNPLAPPAVEQAPVLGEAARVPGIVDQTLLLKSGDHILDYIGLSPTPREHVAQLLLGPLPYTERPQGEFQCAGAVHVRRPRRPSLR